MARQVPPQKSKSRFWLGYGIAIILVLLFLLVAVISIFYLNSRNWQKGLAIQVNIIKPETGYQVEIHMPVEFQATGTDPGGITRLELYADGALIAAQDSPDTNGEKLLTLANIWTPLTIGRHALLSRGYTPTDKFADSSVVYVDVTEATAKPLDVDTLPKSEGAKNPSLADIAAAYGVSPDDLARRNPSLSGSDPTAPLPPGTRIEPPPPPGGSTGGSPPSPPPPPRTGNPAAPTGIRVSADCTSATLNWTDSPDETSYRIYRLGPSDTSPRVVGTIAAGTVTFRDTIPPAAGAQVYRYQVAAVRAGREGLSLMVTATTPASCTDIGTPPEMASDLMLTVAMVDTDAAWDGVYCYLSINATPYERIPAGDLTILSPESANNRYYNLTRLPGGGHYNLTGQPAVTPVTLKGNCRGRRGPLTTFLGTFDISHPQADWNGTLRSASGGTYRFSYCLGPASHPCTPVIPGATLGYLGGLDISGLLFYLPPPTNLRLANSTLACDELGDFLDRMACSSSGFFCSFFGTCEGRQTLLWDWTGSALVPESSLVGYTVYRTTVDLATGSMMTIDWDVNRRGDSSLPKAKLAEQGDLHCGNRVEYRARARQATRVSTLSDPVTFNTPACISTGARLEVTFQTIQINHVEDRGEACLLCPEHDLQVESEGSISAGGSLFPWTTRTFSSNLVARSYDWSSIYLRNQPTGPNALNNNVFRFNITDPARDTVVISALISDLDRYTLWGDTTLTEFCNVSSRIPPHSMADWGSYNQTITLSDNHNPEADCVITVLVRGFPVRR